MPKYKLTIAEIHDSTDQSRYSDGQVRLIYEQTLERLDVAKVVIAANECIALTAAAVEVRRA
jgi:hypothetical protein